MSRLFVEVRSGPLRGKKAAVLPGKSLRIGRTEKADFVVPGDTSMSALHCELLWDGTACEVRDLESIGGTRMDGVPTSHAKITDGATLTAGTTVISVYYEEGIPPKRRHVATPEQRPLRLAALSALRAATPLFGVLDAARDPRVLQLLMRSEEERTSLYEGIQGQALDHVAPYLVELLPSSRLLEKLVMEGWTDAWGIYISWPGKKRDLRSHLRRFLQVIDEETGKPLYFRFYDPRVLRAFLPTCSPMQTADMFGSITTFVMEGESGEILRFSNEGAVP